MDETTYLAMIIERMIEEAKEHASETAATRDCLMTIKGIDGSVTDGDIKNAHNVLAYYFGAANSGYGKGIKSGAATAFSDVLAIIDYDKSYPTLLAKMTSKDKKSIDEVKFYFRNQSDTYSTITLSGGSDSSVWPSRCDVLKFKSKTNRPYILIGYSYDVCEWAVGQNKYKFSLAQNASQ